MSLESRYQKDVKWIKSVMKLYDSLNEQYESVLHELENSRLKEIGESDENVVSALISGCGELKLAKHVGNENSFLILLNQPHPGNEESKKISKLEKEIAHAYAVYCFNLKSVSE